MDEYLKKIAQKYSDTQTSEMGYRTDFENLLETIFTKEQKYHIHHDAKSVGGNKPDFVVLKNAVPMLYIEAKDIGIDLNKTEKSNQMDRYFGYDNLVLTDYVEFRFYRNGEQYGEPISIATYNKNTRTIEPLPQNFSKLEKIIVDFAISHKEPIRRGKHLAKIMGGKAQRIRDNVREMLLSETGRYDDLNKMRDVVKEHLVTTLDNESFADMYAQTLVYGLFAARYNDTTADTFSRTEARELVPKTNPFLRSFFDHIAGTSFPERLRFIVDELCEVFTHANVHELMHEYFRKESLFGEVYETPDPVIHFYEDFLKEYDIKKKMEMGVFYTPRPVVQFIVRAVDSILKTEFGLEKGLSDTTKISIDGKEKDPKTGKEKKIQKEYHKVQVLDIATGTGTFLNEVIGHIYKDMKGQEGRWPAYVENDLLPRLHGFELMMASYTIAHLKLGMKLHDTGAGKVTSRLGVYLTNTLDEPVDYTNQNTLFGIMDSIAEESKNASRIKSEYPIMCVIGNPPYSGASQNMGSYIQDLVKSAYEDEKEKVRKGRRWLQDDYVKFIRFSENLIEKNKEGVMGLITAHGYIDNPTFSGMRQHLRKTFDKIFILDLHGNSNRKEVSPNGGKEENVFDIKTGVAIILGVKISGNQNVSGKVFVSDIYGTRKQKYSIMDQINLEEINWFLIPEGQDIWRPEVFGKNEYEKGISVTELFPVSSTGIVTAIDSLSIFLSKKDLEDTTKKILNSENPFRDFSIKDALQSSKEERLSELKKAAEDNPVMISYRPFDNRYMYYTTKTHGWINSPRYKVMKNLINKDNFALVFARSQKNPFWNAIFISNLITETKLGESSTQSALAPLYLYTEQNEKVPNLNKEIWDKVNEIVGEATPENILDYIYAVLHSPSYREKYKEFLKIDFPRVPYPTTKEEFWDLVPLGTKLRGLHLLTDPVLTKPITTFSIAGSNEVEKITYKNGSVYINETQYFGDVPETAWNFYIGGYQPAQKWLKDRKGKTLSNNDIEHYQKMIVAMIETEKVMKEIDNLK